VVLIPDDLAPPWRPLRLTRGSHGSEQAPLNVQSGQLLCEPAARATPSRGVLGREGSAAVLEQAVLQFAGMVGASPSVPLSVCLRCSCNLTASPALASGSPLHLSQLLMPLPPNALALHPGPRPFLTDRRLPSQPSISSPGRSLAVNNAPSTDKDGRFRCFTLQRDRLPRSSQSGLGNPRFRNYYRLGADQIMKRP